MTMVYARIANRTVAEEYHEVTEKVEALAEPDLSAETPRMRPAADRAPAHAGQRVVHPTIGARLFLRVDP